jgi:hypothetical protein
MLSGNVLSPCIFDARLTAWEVPVTGNITKLLPVSSFHGIATKANGDFVRNFGAIHSLIGVKLAQFNLQGGPPFVIFQRQNFHQSPFRAGVKKSHAKAQSR